MLLVIFGAGASFDSAQPERAQQWRPPLAADLVSDRFNVIAAGLPESQPIIDLVRRRIKADQTADRAPSFEAELARIVEESQGSEHRRRQLVAFRFYLRRVICDAIGDWLQLTFDFTHYLTLLNKLYQWQRTTQNRILLATFNYDDLLDRAALRLVGDWDFRDRLPRYIERQDFRLFKLHGSTDWCRTTEAPDWADGMMMPAAAMAAAAKALDISDGEITARQPDERVGGPNPTITIPAMAIPTATKYDFECPSDHLKALKSDLPNVTHLLIVGWRAAEEHAVRLLAGSSPREGLFPSYALGIVSGSQEGVEEVKSNLGEVGKKGRPLLQEAEGFSAFIERLDEHMEPFLAAGWD